MNTTDQYYMERALTLAAKGRGSVSPNPMVGAVMVNNGKVVGEGFHRAAGGSHAEIFCIQEAGHLSKGATLYVNLEPCSHYGRTPPCIKAVIQTGVSKVVIAMQDPNPLVSGKGIQLLRDNGIEVVTGVMEEQARALNRVFIKYITTQKPFVAVKSASTLDGKTAAKTGDSKWITRYPAREYVHQLRNEYDSILVGINTVLTDDPSLNCRIDNPNKRDPIRVVLDSKLRIPLNAKIINSSASAPLIIFTAANNREKIKELTKMGVEVIEQRNEADEAIEQKEGTGISIDFVMTELAKREISSVLVEGGSSVIWSFFQEGFVDKYYMFIAPKIIGGKEAVPIIGGAGIEIMNNAIEMKWQEVKFIGDDLLLTCYKELF